MPTARPAMNRDTHAWFGRERSRLFPNGQRHCRSSNDRRAKPASASRRILAPSPRRSIQGSVCSIGRSWLRSHLWSRCSHAKPNEPTRWFGTKRYWRSAIAWPPPSIVPQTNEGMDETGYGNAIVNTFDPPLGERSWELVRRTPQILSQIGGNEFPFGNRRLFERLRGRPNPTNRSDVRLCNSRS